MKSQLLQYLHSRGAMMFVTDYNRMAMNAGNLFEPELNSIQRIAAQNPLQISSLTLPEIPSAIDVSLTTSSKPPSGILEYQANNNGFIISVPTEKPDPTEKTLLPPQSPEPPKTSEKPNTPKVWEVRNLATGRAEIDLSANYRLTIDEFSHNIVIENFASGEKTTIWGELPTGNPGETAPLEFWGTTTFVLEDRTRITVQTIAAPDNSDKYILDNIVVTKGDRALVITGAGNEKTGDLNIDSNRDGWSLDLETADNFVLKENAAGLGWVRPCKTAPVTQEQLDKTAVGRKFGPGEARLSMNDYGKLFTRFLNNFITTIAESSLRNTSSSLSAANEDRAMSESKDAAIKAAILAAEIRQSTAEAHDVSRLESRR